MKQRIIDAIIKVEGGYVNDPNDSGGATKYGITVAVARENGYTGDMKNLPYNLAFQIYSKKYWDSLNLDAIEKVAPKIAEEMADTAVNMGVDRAGTFLQRCLNALNNQATAYPDIVVDGGVGSKTLSALNSFLSLRKLDGEEVLLKMLNCLQGEFYISLAEKRDKDEKFVFGWFKNRVVI